MVLPSSWYTVSSYSFLKAFSTFSSSSKDSISPIDTGMPKPALLFK